MREAETAVNNISNTAATSSSPTDYSNIIKYKICAHFKFVKIVMSVKATTAVSLPIVIAVTIAVLD